MVIMASGIARGRVRTKTTTAAAAALEMTESCSLGLPCTNVILTSMLRPIGTCQNKISADHSHVTISRAQVYSSSRSRVF